MKGSTSITELENMPNKLLHTLWKLYIDTMTNEKKQQAAAMEQTMDDVEDAMT